MTSRNQKKGGWGLKLDAQPGPRFKLHSRVGPFLTPTTPTLGPQLLMSPAAPRLPRHARVAAHVQDEPVRALSRPESALARASASPPRFPGPLTGGP